MEYLLALKDAGDLTSVNAIRTYLERLENTQSTFFKGDIPLDEVFTMPSRKRNFDAALARVPDTILSIPDKRKSEKRLSLFSSEVGEAAFKSHTDVVQFQSEQDLGERIQADMAVRIRKPKVSKSIIVSTETRAQMSTVQKLVKAAQETIATDEVASKRCTCQKTRCLKFYCDCFASNIYCSFSCSCEDCANTNATKHKKMREDALIVALDKNPEKFTLKEVKGRHGCNCKRSGCLKRYCECFAEGRQCTVSCRCFGCENGAARLNSHTKSEAAGPPLSDAEKNSLTLESARVPDQ